MKQREKIAIVRILTDLVKSDTVIDMREIELFGEICNSYNIDGSAVLAEAQNITLADAVNELKGLSAAKRQILVSHLERLALADGKCESSEALLVLALRYVLESGGGDIIDCSTGELDNIEPFTVFYVESDYDEGTNDVIKANYRTIDNELRLAGFDFVYIPCKSRYFSQVEQGQLMSIIRHLAPAVSDSSIKAVYDKMCNLTTVDFCRSLLYNKMGLKSLYDTEPSFLVKIADSRVAFKPVHNYFKFIITGNVLDDIRYFIDCYRHIVKDGGITVLQETHNGSRFEYRGFNKSIFDLLAFPGKKFDSRILIDVSRHRILFEDINAELDLSAYERALYVFLLYADVMGKVVRRNDTSMTRVKRLNIVFNKIYNMVGKWENDEEKTYITPGLPASLSRIKKKLSELELLDNKKLYIPETVDDVLSVKVDSAKVYVLDRVSGKKELMRDSEIWKTL